MVISNKNSLHELLHELPNNVIIRILGNWETQENPKLRGIVA